MKTVQIRNTVVKQAIQRSWGAGAHQKSKKAIRRNDKVSLLKEVRYDTTVN